jgi:hypothetical protein
MSLSYLLSLLLKEVGSHGNLHHVPLYFRRLLLFDLPLRMRPSFLPASIRSRRSSLNAGPSMDIVKHLVDLWFAMDFFDRLHCL